MAKPAIQVKFGEKIRALRTERGHSQEGFAGLANLDRGAYGKIERGEINIGLVTIAKIAVALELDLAELLSGVTFAPDEVRAIPRSTRGPKSIGSR